MTNVCKEEIERIAKEQTVHLGAQVDLEALWRKAEQDAELDMRELNPLGAGLGTATGWHDAQFNFFVWFKLKVFERVIKELEEELARALDARTDRGPDDRDSTVEVTGIQTNTPADEAHFAGTRPQAEARGEPGAGSEAGTGADTGPIPSEESLEAKYGPSIKAEDA